MPARRLAVLAVLLLAAAPASAATAGRARLLDAKGKEVGAATLDAAEGGGVRIQVRVTGLAPGTHGFHVHAAGRCDPPDFKSAGPHFNPAGKQHGHDNPQGAHAGDLPNLDVGKDGAGQATIVVKDLTLDDGPASVFGKDGTALVVHADPDDGRTDPAGNAGARIACGVVERG